MNVSASIHHLLTRAPCRVVLHCSETLPLLLPAAMVAAWAISYANTAVWAPAALFVLAATAAVSWWQERGGKAQASGSSSAAGAPSPEQTLQLIRDRRSVFPKDFSGEQCPARCVHGRGLQAPV